jgi:hypothetical protein
VVEYGRGNCPVAQVQVLSGGVHAKDVTDIFIVGCVVGEVAVHHEQAKETYINHQYDFAVSDDLVGCNVVQGKRSSIANKP